MKLILIRHAESDKNAGKSTKENRLTPKGQLQAKKLAKYLSQEKIDHIYCSNSTRCIETMEALLQNRDDETIGISFSKLITAKKKTENWEEIQTRIRLFMADLSLQHEDGESIVMISHAASIKMILFLISGNLEEINNASTTILEIGGKKIKKILVNEIQYLN
jgi:broad specificity phosphatase PhoE